MKNMSSNLQAFIFTLTCLSIFAGCNSDVRREGLGGGALAPVKVTLLRESSQGEDSGSSGASAGPKITEFGTIVGKISVNGSIPSLSPLLAQGATTKDSICAAEAVPNQTVVGAGGGLGNVFIYLKKVPNVDVPEPPQDPLLIDQKGCVFIPHTLVVQTGRPVILKNSDPVAHNVNIKGSANQFNSTIPPGGQSEYAFQLTERLPANSVCDFHSWMSAYVLPVDHPWAATSSEDGSFRIENVPAGKMEFAVWHEKVGYIERSLVVDVAPNVDSQMSVSVDSAKLQ